MWRVTINTYRLGWEDSKSQNEVLRAHGRRRLASAAAVHVLLTASLGGILKLIEGISDDEDEAIRSGLPSYVKDASLVYSLGQGKRNGDDCEPHLPHPFSFVANPFVASFRHIRMGNLEESVAVWGRYVSQEFFGENITAGRVLDVSRNADESTGRAIYQPTDSLATKSYKALAHIVDGAYNPALIKQINRFYDASVSDTPKDSIWFTPAGIALGTIAPFKPRAYNLADVEYRAFSNLRMTNANLWMPHRTHACPLSALRPEGPQPLRGSGDAQRKVWTDVKRNIEAFEGLGRNRREVVSQAIEAGLSRKRVQMAINGFTERPVFNDDSRRKIKAIDPGRHNAYMEAVKATPSRLALD
jgi:hypothetical protein